MEDSIMVGKYAAPFLLTVIFAAIYSRFPDLTDKTKNDIAVLAGIVLGELALFLKWDAGTSAITASGVILALIDGFLLGTNAVGIWKTFNIQSGKSSTPIPANVTTGTP